MPEFTTFIGSSADVQVGFVEREATPCELMGLSLQLHLRGRLLILFESSRISVSNAASGRSNAAPTSSATASETPIRKQPTNGFRAIHTYETALSEHCLQSEAVYMDEPQT